MQQKTATSISKIGQSKCTNSSPWQCPTACLANVWINWTTSITRFPLFLSILTISCKINISINNFYSKLNYTNFTRRVKNIYFCPNLIAYKNNNVNYMPIFFLKKKQNWSKVKYIAVCLVIFIATMLLLLQHRIIFLHID